MMDYSVRTPHQLGQVVRGQRKLKRLTQKAVGISVGLLPKTISALESSPERVTVDSLFKLLSALDLEIVLRPKSGADEQMGPSDW